MFCVFAVPTVYLAVRAGKATYTASRDMSEVERKAHALSGALLHRNASEERTLFGYSSELGKRFDDAFEYSRVYRLKVDFKYYFKNKASGVVFTFLSLAAVAAVLPSVGRGELAIGMFIALVGAALDLTGRFSSLNGIVSDLTQKREYLRDLSDFMALPEEERACDLPETTPAFETIEFREVSFKYPGTDKLVLDNISFTIHAGYNYSFVGANGAGKTTVVKLLTGLYPDYEGEILVDGKSLGSMPSAQRKGLSAVVYQDFARYEITLRDNISLGDANAKDAADIERRIIEKISSVQLDGALENLPSGLDTPLGKTFHNSVDLSGGEWQRVAMARAMMNPAPLCILDEPTSSLDPKSESQLYERFRDISHERTTLFISHRLGSTKFADTIFAFESGRIVESGAHSELMERGGLYAEMFRSQASWYIDESKPEGGGTYAT
jgi:ATP-binding cassette subfamily B protein